MRIKAPAKLNLNLHITGKTSQEYHLLDSLVVFTEFGDELEFSEADDLSLEITGSFAQTVTTEDNLVLHAARLLQPYASRPCGAHIVLHKEIPVGAGLGGGSSDAAVTLKALHDMWGISLSDEKLAELALSLGSDIPVCLSGRSAWIAGIGDKITPVAIHADLWMVLVNSGQPLATPKVYAAYDGDFRNEQPHAKKIGSSQALFDIVMATYNDLQPAATTLCPEIDEVLNVLGLAPGAVMSRMSGSGATCFGLFRSVQEAQQACSLIKQQHANWWCVATKMIGSHEA